VRFLNICALITVLLQLLFSAPAPAEIPSPHILILNSYHEGYRGTDDIVQGFRQAITETLPEATFKIEYFDSKNYSGSDYEEFLFQLLTYKYKDHLFELIFAADDYAYDFIEKHHASLFPELPVVFAGTNSFESGRLEGKKQFIGVDERPSFKETVGLIFKLLPSTKKVIVIHDSSITGQLNSKAFRSETSDFTSQADFVYWVEQPLEELLVKIRDLPENAAIVYFASYVKELSGKVHGSSAALKSLSEASPVPLFGGWEFSLNNGIVGGKLINLSEHGLLAGQIATKILSGEKTGLDTKLFPSPNVYMFDDTELQQFAIPDSNLPEDSVIINRPPTFYQQHKTTLFATLATFLGFLVIISFIKIYSSRDKLRQSEQRHRSILKTAMDGILLTDEQGHFVEVNETYCRMSGYSMQELLTMSITDVEQLETAGDTASRIEKIMALGEDRFESQHRRKDGNLFDVDVSIQYRSVDGGQLVVFLRDITERKHTEQELKASEEKYRRLFETMAQGVIYQAADGFIVSANPAAEKILGLTFGQMQGKTSMDPRWQMIEEDGAAVSGESHPAMTALRTGQIVGPTIKGVFHPDENRHVWLNITAIPLFRPEENAPYQVYSTFEDITERKEAQDALQKSLHRIEAIYASLNDAIVLVNPNTRQIIECNSATAKMFGYHSKEILGQDTHFMHVDQEHFEQFGREALAAYANPGYYVTEFEMRRKDGSVFPTESYVRPVLDSQGHILYVVSVVRDITERKNAQLALQQKNQEMEQFVYSVSHDLKSPLVTVKTFAGMLRQDLQNADQSQINEDLDYIDKAADKMQQLLDALLQYSGIGTIDTQAQTLSSGQLVENCLTVLAGILQRHDVNVSNSQLTQKLHGNLQHFEQVWQNLIENAVKYSGDQPHPLIEIGATQQGQDVVFYVRDNGIGLAPEHNERIFNLFSQLNPGSEGSGLGLALVKKIVSIYQGRIWVESQGHGKGSCFMFTLPGALAKDDKEE